jgi:hypothetical protein
MELTKQKNYQQTFDLACETIKMMKVEERAEKAGADYQKTAAGEEVFFHFFSEPYRIQFPLIEFTSPSKKTISLVTRILLLHYLLQADGAPLTGRWVGYKDIPGGLLYASVFARRVTDPLVRKFGKSAKGFGEVGVALGGTMGDTGDASFLIQAFPRLPMQYVLWEGDEEFSPTVQVLFDSSVDHYLSLEDIVVLGQMATGRLVHRSAVQ